MKRPLSSIKIIFRPARQPEMFKSMNCNVTQSINKENLLSVESWVPRARLRVSPSALVLSVSEHSFKWKINNATVHFRSVSLSFARLATHSIWHWQEEETSAEAQSENSIFDLRVCAHRTFHSCHFTNSSGLNLYLSSHCKHMRSTMCGTQMPKHFNMNKRHERHSFSENAQCHFYCPTYHKVHTHTRVRATQLNEMNAMQIQRTHLI